MNNVNHRKVSYLNNIFPEGLRVDMYGENLYFGKQKRDMPLFNFYGINYLAYIDSKKRKKKQNARKRKKCRYLNLFLFK